MNNGLFYPDDALNFMRSSGWNFSDKWSGSADVYVWLRGNIECGSRIYLNLQIYDKNGKKTILVDRCMATQLKSILMTGRVRLSGSGLVSKIGLYVRVEGFGENSLVLDEACVKPLFAHRALAEAV